MQRMRNLLSAGLVRLARCKALWLSCAFAAVYQLYSILSRCSWGGGAYQAAYSLDGGFFSFAGLAGIAAAIICSFLIGPEYSDGTLRNKVTAGCSRRDIYLCSLILSVLASLLTCLSAILPGLALGLPLLGGFEIGPVRAAWMILGICALSAAYASLFTLLDMLLSHRVASLTASVLLALGLLAIGGMLNGALTAPPTIQDYSLAVNGQLQAMTPQPNPAYVPPGPLRTLLEFWYDFLPGGQTGQYVTFSAARPALLMAYDALIFAASSIAGLALFRRKDLN